MRFQSLALFLLVLLVSMAKNQAAPGGYSPIKDINDPYVIEIAHFAINEHNKQTGAKLEFKQVIKGESQVVAGTNYRLTLTTNSGGSIPDKYVAVVYDAPFKHIRKLTFFAPINA